jgi:hypothetical protein
MTHYDDEILLQYAEGSSPIGGEIASHLVDCTKCNVTIDEQRDLIEILRGAAVWEHVPETSTPAEASCVRELAAFQERIAAEDADADAILDDVLSGPPSWWRTRLTKSATHLTGGLVRQILARADGLHATAPLRAYDMTRLAVDIADELPVSAYASDFVITLRGHALREHAYVLMCLGRYREAVEFCDAAERAFAQMPIADYELARVARARARLSIHRSSRGRGVAGALERRDVPPLRRHRPLRHRVYDGGLDPAVDGTQARGARHLDRAA